MRGKWRRYREKVDDGMRFCETAGSGVLSLTTRFTVTIIGVYDKTNRRDTSLPIILISVYESNHNYV